MLQIMKLIDQVGSNAYSATDNEDGTANVEMTAARANKLQTLLGDDNVSVVGLIGSHVLVQVNLEALATAAEENKRTSRGSSVNVNITSRIVYAIEHDDNVNEVSAAWWGRDEMSGGITVNGSEHEILPGLAKDYYDEPDDPDKAAEWQPERTVYVVALPTEDGELVLTSYGVTNLIRRVSARNEQIG